MQTLKFQAALLAMMTLAAWPLHASESSVPVVYEDEFIKVQAGVPDVGTRPLHFGDRMSLVVKLEFDPSLAQPQLLDGDFFARSFTEQRSVALIGQPKLVRTNIGRDKHQLYASWSFQIIGCPGTATSCPGARSYELPILSINYQLLDEAGKMLNHKAARFRPWPGQIEIAPALVTSAQDADFAAYFPAGAYPQAANASVGGGLSWLAALIGFSLLAMTFTRAAPRAAAAASPTANTGPMLRWQRALAAVSGPSLNDEERSDLLRRSVTWYCLDELGQNPYQWLRDRRDTASQADLQAGKIGALFLDVLQQDRIDRQSLDGYLQRFAGLAGERAVATGAETPA